MKQHAAKRDQASRHVKRLGEGGWRDWAVIFLLFAIVFGLVIYAFIEGGEDRSPSISELISRFSIGIPVLLLCRSGILVGILLGNFLQYIRQDPRTAEQKNALVKLAKREGLWYAGAVSSLLLFYRLTPFIGHIDTFFLLAIAVPLSLILIFALWVFLTDTFNYR